VSLKLSLLAGALLVLAAVTASAAPNERPVLTSVTAVRAANYGAPSRLVQQRTEVDQIVEELGQLRKKPWRRGDTKMRCYATVVLLDGERPLATFRVRPDLIVERPFEKGASSYSLKITDTDLPALTKLLGEIPIVKKCD
jgi:hypothetical protein